MTKLMLASASPRRKELLEQIGLNPSICPVDIDESIKGFESPEEYVRRLSLEKAQAAREELLVNEINFPAESFLIASDTTVVVNDSILGKPANKDNFKDMILQLSGRKHHVLSAVTVLKLEKSEVVRKITICETTEVLFRDISMDEVEFYWSTGEPVDKAGGYGIQGIGAVFVDRISGSYSNVVGLPLSQTYMTLRELGFPFEHSI